MLPIDSRDTADADTPRPHDYVVVARRYRPQAFDELVGQEHVARALTNAIAANRVGHAYLFTGARGVGKTSAARILAKALNCVQGPTATPCNRCDICQSISTGDDVDVLEIDGASNRGIDEIRELRQNVNIRPSRARFKIYIIDEVHMLTAPAFNALLKTLEEPPERVKFIFCTTEAEKIPITILSRCQRFDFAGIRTDSIAQRLAQIARAEGVEAEPEAIALLARRASGSMRDGQSLLEQLLAYGDRRITVAEVHGLLGTAASGRVDALVTHLTAADAAAVLGDLDSALGEGVDVSQLVVQLLGFFRDAMVAATGATDEAMLYTSPDEQPLVARVAGHFGVENLLAILQIFDQALARMRYSTQPRTLAELALVRIARLENLTLLTDLIQKARNGSITMPASVSTAPRIAAPVLDADELKKKVRRGTPTPLTGSHVSAATLTAESAPSIWQQAIGNLQDTVAEFAKVCQCVELVGSDRLVVSFLPHYSYNRTICDRPEKRSRLEQAVADIVGRPVKVEFQVLADSPATPAANQPARPAHSRQRLAEKADHPLVRRAIELFDARPTRIEEPQA